MNKQLNARDCKVANAAIILLFLFTAAAVLAIVIRLLRFGLRMG